MSQEYTFTGTVASVGDITKVGARGFEKAEFVVGDGEDKYPTDICFVCAGKSADLAKREGIQRGDRVRVSFNVSSRQWNERWFTEARAWKIEVLRKASGSRGAEARTPEPEQSGGDYATDIEAEDVPF